MSSPPVTVDERLHRPARSVPDNAGSPHRQQCRLTPSPAFYTLPPLPSCNCRYLFHLEERPGTPPAGEVSHMALGSRVVALLPAVVLISPMIALAQQSAATQAREDALARLRAAHGNNLRIAEHKATGAVRFIRVEPGSGRALSSVPAPTAADKQQQSRAFFRDYGAAAGISDPFSLRLAASTADTLGETHLTWQQFYGAVPVFAATIKTHFDRSNRLKAVTGTAIPDIAVDPAPSWSGERSAQVARAAVVADRGESDALRIAAT